MKVLLLIVLLFISIPLWNTQIDNKILNENFVKPTNSHIVTATVYTIDTLKTVTQTASGFLLDMTNPAKDKIIAISRDLQSKYHFGSKVQISNAGKYNGIYTVRDLMHPKWINKIDILINPNDPITKLYRVILTKI